MTGHVYIAKPQNADFFKVGHSVSIENRMRQLRTCYGPTEFVCVRSDDPRADEKRILRNLSRNRRKHSGSGFASETVACGENNSIFNKAKQMLRELEVFPVMRIRSARMAEDELQFLVQWGSPYNDPCHDSWEPYENVKDLQALDVFFQTRRWSKFVASQKLSISGSISVHGGSGA